MEHVSAPLHRALGRVARRALAPLDPDAFLRWSFRFQGLEGKGFGPLTVDDVWFELRRHGEVAKEDVRRDYVRLAARVRRNQRLGLAPFEGI